MYIVQLYEIPPLDSPSGKFVSDKEKEYGVVGCKGLDKPIFRFQSGGVHENFFYQWSPMNS